MIYNFHIFTRTGDCIYYHEWNRTKEQTISQEEVRHCACIALCAASCFERMPFVHPAAPRPLARLCCDSGNVVTKISYPRFPDWRPASPLAANLSPVCSLAKPPCLDNSQEFKLMYGMIFSIKSFAKRLAPKQRYCRSSTAFSSAFSAFFQCLHMGTWNSWSPY